MTEQSMVERVARAMSESDVADLRKFLAREGLLGRIHEFREQLLPWDEMNAMSQADYRRRVRVAIRALREPTEWMLKAEMDRGGYGYMDECYQADPKEIWQAMIDAALKESPK